MKKNRKTAALAAAFPKTIPIMTGFLFLGMAYGLYMHVSGFSWIWSTVTAIVVFGGSLEFLIVSMLLAPFAPVQCFIMALMVQARHLFYGIAMLDKYKGMGWKKFYLIYGMCDESFSINCSTEVPENIDRGWFYFWVSLLNQSYWVIGVTIGGLVGQLFTFNTTGLDFVMTAMFTAIFIDQMKKEKQPITAIIGMLASIICLVIFGADSFLIPTMACILVFLFILRKPIERKGGFEYT